MCFRLPKFSTNCRSLGKSGHTAFNWSRFLQCDVIIKKDCSNVFITNIVWNYKTLTNRKQFKGNSIMLKAGHSTWPSQGRTEQFQLLGGSPGLVVMGRDSRPEGRGFESWHRILDGHFSHIFVVKLYCLFEKTENKQKRGRGWSIFFKKNKQFQLTGSRFDHSTRW